MASTARPVHPEPEFGLLTRWILFALGVWIMTVGVALSIHATLGTSAISTVPASLAGPVPLSFGVLSILMNIAFVAVQAVLLRRRFDLINLLQVPAAVFFGWMCRRFGTVKQCFDWALVILAVILSFALAGELRGAREGTVFAAFAVGGLVKLFQRLWSGFWARRRR